MIKKIKKKAAKLEKKQDLLDVSDIPGLKVIPIKTRPFAQFDWDFTGSTKVLIPSVNPHDIVDAIVKVNIRVKAEDAHKIDIKSIEESIKPYAYLLKPIVPVIQKERKIRIERITADLSPLEAIKSWLIEKGKEDIDTLYEMAEEIIRESEEDE